MNVNGARQFVDTNVLVYAHDTSAGEKHERAAELVRSLWESRQGCLSVQVLQEFYVSVTRKVASPLDMDQAQRLVRDLSFWHIQIPDAGDVLGAIDLQRRYQLSFWDAMIVRSAAECGCQIIWSEDLQHGQEYIDMRLVNPFLEG